MKNNDAYILDFREMDDAITEADSIEMVGGKGGNLIQLCRIDGIHVPEGFCITTKAYKEIIEHNPVFHSLLDQLNVLKAKDRKEIGELSTRIRKMIEETAVPERLGNELTRHLQRLGERDAYAIRSSATAEDLPTASFAGQQDTFLNIVGKDEILFHIRKCWASLFTDRAVIYRMQNGISHNQVYLAVVVQKMVFPQAAGILFTADPLTSNRKMSSINASFGLGEALVSGLVSADSYKVFKDEIVEKMIASKKIAIYARPEGGTVTERLRPDQEKMQTLTDRQILQLAQIGRVIEKYFACPQDIEWCLVDDRFSIVQSRPITTLYPIPSEAETAFAGEAATNDQQPQVYISVGHQQMMTDAMKPLGLSFFLLTTSARMRTAGGRLFVDVTPMLASPGGRETLVNVLGKSDPIIRDALTTLLMRKDFIKSEPDEKREQEQVKNDKAAPAPDYQQLNDYDPTIVSELIKANQQSVEALKQNIRTKSGTGLFDFIREDIQQLKKLNSDPRSFGVIMTGMNAASWINEKMNEWLGERNAADVLAHSVPNNITSQMGLALLDVADVIRAYPEVIEYLKQADDDDFLDELRTCKGGIEARSAICAFLDNYGMRCPGEVDITRTRWTEKPMMIVPLILSNIRQFEPGESKRKFRQGQEEAFTKENDLLKRLKQLPDGEQKAEETKRMIDRLRNFAGYREYPKYGIVSRYFVYKQALLKEAEQLVHAGVIPEKQDCFYLSFDELREVVRTNKLDDELISKRKEAYKQYEKLRPPRVFTSDGEIITGSYKRENLPDGAIAGLPVSSGIIEGRARVILDMERAQLEEGDILVTRFTDPSWTPLFVSIKGLVTEVGGLMTHGAVIAREYGLPAVVGVEEATARIANGQRIRVNGTDGYVEVLTDG